MIKIHEYSEMFAYFAEPPGVKRCEDLECPCNLFMRMEDTKKFMIPRDDALTKYSFRIGTLVPRECVAEDKNSLTINAGQRKLLFLLRTVGTQSKNLMTSEYTQMANSLFCGKALPPNAGTVVYVSIHPKTFQFGEK